MRIVVPYGMGETKRRLRRGMRVESEPVLFDLPMMLKTELRGNVEGDCTVIEGKFRHTGAERVAVPAVVGT